MCVCALCVLCVICVWYCVCQYRTRLQMHAISAIQLPFQRPLKQHRIWKNLKKREFAICRSLQCRYLNSEGCKWMSQSEELKESWKLFWHWNCLHKLAWCKSDVIQATSETCIILLEIRQWHAFQSVSSELRKRERQARRPAKKVMPKSPYHLKLEQRIRL